MNMQGAHAPNKPMQHTFLLEGDFSGTPSQ